MAEFDELDPLAKEDEEYKMFIEYTEEFKKQEKGSIKHKSGKATQIAIHNLLYRNGIRLPQNPEAKIQEVETRMNLLYLLKIGVDKNRIDYSIRDVDAVLKTTATAVGKTTSERIRDTFNKFEQSNPKLRFLAVVLSERLSYPYPITLDIVFTLVAREKKADKLYLKETVVSMQEKGDLRKPKEDGFEDLLKYLKEL